MTSLLHIWKNRVSKIFDNPVAIVPFFKKRLVYNRVADLYISQYQTIHFLNYNETIESIINNNNLSIVRFGDDVFDMILGIGLYFDGWHQTYDSKLATRLKEVLSSSEDKLLVCFNPEFILKTKADFVAEGIGEQYHFWTNSKIFLKDYVHFNQTYGSALSFQERYNDKIDYGRILRYMSKKNLIIVTSNTKRFGGRIFGKTTDYIDGPPSNAWKSYDEILRRVLQVASRYNKEEVLIMSSLGPTSKVMIFDLVKNGYTGWDIGQLFDIALHKII